LNDRERDIIRKTVLQLIMKGVVRWTNIEKLVCISCGAFATTNTIKRQFYGYLLANGYIERVSRGKYAVTEKGRKLYVALS
jgi:predicted transcriptional regulator